MVDLRSYTFTITFSHEDGEFVARCVEFPSLSCLDSDACSALLAAQNLVQSVIIDMEALGDSIPTPTGVGLLLGNPLLSDQPLEDLEQRLSDANQHPPSRIAPPSEPQMTVASPGVTICSDPPWINRGTGALPPQPPPPPPALPDSPTYTNPSQGFSDEGICSQVAATTPLSARDLARLLYEELRGECVTTDPDYFRAVADGEYDVNHPHCGVTPLLRALARVAAALDWRKS
jgi:hypothetical protein